MLLNPFFKKYQLLIIQKWLNSVNQIMLSSGREHFLSENHQTVLKYKNFRIKPFLVAHKADDAGSELEKYRDKYGELNYSSY